MCQVLDVSVLNSLNTGNDHCLIRGKTRSDSRFDWTKTVTQLKRVDTGKLQDCRRELQVEVRIDL